MNYSLILCHSWTQIAILSTLIRYATSKAEWTLYISLVTFFTYRDLF